MNARHLALVVLACGSLAASSWAQDSPGKRSNLITLSGCVVPDLTRPGKFALTDIGDAEGYRLVGMDVRDYLGKRVELAGERPRRLKVTGGLYPSPNVAGQAGAIDPTKAAIAAAQPNTTGAQPMSELRVRSVRAVPGSCPEK